MNVTCTLTVYLLLSRWGLLFVGCHLLCIEALHHLSVDDEGEDEKSAIMATINEILELEHQRGTDSGWLYSSAII